MSSSKGSPGLRKRQLSPDDATLQRPSDASTPSAAQKPSPTYRYLIALVSLVLSATYFYAVQKPGSELASSYILCSREGAKIYTVDEVRPNVECLVVRDGYFTDAGWQGERGPRY